MNALFSYNALKKFLLLSLFCTSLYAQVSDSLPRSIPETEGVSSDGIISFLDAVSQSKHEFHSFMILRHGKVIAEGWWNPYRADLKHTMYSVSKSFTATAVGFAVNENKLSVDDKVISFFPEYLPDTVSENLSRMRIRDLLSMSTGHGSDPTAGVRNNNEWIKGFLRHPVQFEPGTKFVYNSAATFMLSAIVQKVTGQKILDYLQPRLFDPLGIRDIDWETSPEGINTGGWGLRLKTEDMAKFGLLFLQKGKWKGKQIITESWINEATSKKIDQEPNARQSKKDSSDWLQGYCYQMWRCRHNAYRGDGAFGQFIVMMPDQDAVVIITSESTDLQGEMNLIWDHLLPAFHNTSLPENQQSYKRLKTMTESLALPVPPAVNNTSIEIFPETFYSFDINEKGVKSTSYDFGNNMCSLYLVTEAGEYKLDFAPGKWEPGETERPGPYIAALAKSNRKGQSPFKTAGCFTWKDDVTLELTLIYIESPHKEIITCRFVEDEVLMEFKDVFGTVKMKGTRGMLND